GHHHQRRRADTYLGRDSRRAERGRSPGHRGAFVEYFPARAVPPHLLCQPRRARHDLRSRATGLRTGLGSGRQRHRGGAGRGRTVKIPAVRIGGRRAPPAPDAAVIRTLAGLLAETGLTEIEYAVGDTRIRLARGPSGVAVSSPVATNGAALPATNGAAPHAEPPHAHAEKTATNGAHPPGTPTSPIR